MAERRFTDLELERSLAGDLPAARAAELDAQATPADRARLAALRAEHAAFLASVDVEAEVRRIEQRVERARPAPRRPAWLRWLAPAGALAAAAAVLLVLGRGGKPTPAPTPPQGDDLQAKGGAIALVIHAAAEGGSVRLASGDTVAPGARLRFEVEGTQPGYVAVIGLDGAGTTTVYYPYGADAAAAIGRDRLLPGAIELDATPGDERFLAVFSPRPFAIASALPALRGGPLPPGLTAAEVVLHKRGR